nr:urea ABC transporter substrate-binding protein [Natronomonas pharaonis]
MSGSRDDPITLAVLENRSGKFAELGTSKWQASRLAVEELNESGGALGRKIELIDPDPASDVKRYRQLTTEILEERDVDAIWAGYASSEREVVRPITNAHRQLYFYTNQYEGGVCDRYTFPVGATARQQLGAVLPYLVSEYGPKIFTIAADYNFGHLSSDWVEILAAENDAEVIGTEFVPLSETSFEWLVDRIEAADPDFVMSMLVGDNHAEFFREKATRDLSMPIGTSTAMAQAFEHKRYEPPAFADVYAGVNYMEELSTQENTTFVERFYEMFPDADYINQEAQNNYVSIHLYAKAVEAAGTTDQDAVIEQLESGLSFDAPEGRVAIDGATHHINHTMRIARADEDHNIEFFNEQRIDETFLSQTVGCDLREVAETTQYRPALFHQQGTFDSMHDALEDRVQDAHESEKLREQLEARTQAYSDAMRAAAEGDLTTRMSTGANNEALAVIAEEFNEMIAEMERTLADIGEFADDVASASREVTTSTDEVRATSESVASSIDQISDGAADQNESLQVVNDEMSDLSATIEEVAATTDEVADVAAKTAAAGSHGQEAATDAIAGMNETEQKAEQAVDAIHELEAEVTEIDALIDQISEIAEQTNILALNANIEAARTGGDGESNGDGFAVVANEVKELSEEVKQAAESAESRVEAIQERTDRSTTAVEATSERIAGASEQVTEAVEALEEIAAYADETNDGIQEISNTTEDQATSTEETVSMIDEVASISEETTTEAESVAAAAEEQSASLAEVSASATELSERAAELSEAISRFEVGADLDDDAVDTSGAAEPGVSD